MWNSGDQIEVFKILNGYENIDRNIFFSRSRNREGLYSKLIRYSYIRHLTLIQTKLLNSLVCNFCKLNMYMLDIFPAHILK